MSGHEFVKQFVRETTFDPFLPPTPVFARAEPSPTVGEIYTVTVSGKVIEETEAAGLAPKSVVIVVGALVVLWLVFVTMGILCKFFNKPRSQLHSGDYTNSKGLYHPSAAGYGADRSSQATGPSPGQLQPNQDPRKMYGSKTNLLASVGPMGKGSMDDSPGPSTPDLSLSMTRSREYFDTPTGSSVVRTPGQHHRTTSSSVGLPGPSASRRGPNAGFQNHPPVAGPSSMTMDPFTSASGAGPDGGGFRPGQLFNHSNFGGAGPSHLRDPPAAPAGPRSSRVFNQGPPPARSNSKRRSRYSRAPRIESVGPGQIRASRYFDEAYATDELGAGSPDRPQARNNRKSRYGEDRMSKRMSTRRSQYGGGGASFGGGWDAVRSPSIYGLQAAEEEAIRRAHAEGFGAGSPSIEGMAGMIPPAHQQQQQPYHQGQGGNSQHHPLGLSRVTSPPDRNVAPGRGPSPLGGANGPRYPAHAPGFTGGMRQAQAVGAGGRQLV